MPSIVTVNVTQQVASAPDNLQRTGALISQGGTTLAVDATSLITQPSDLTALTPTPIAITSLSWSGGVVTATTSVTHPYPASETINLDIAGAVPAGYNGTFPCTIVDTTHFTYPLTNNPGAETTPGTVTPYSVLQLQQMVNTFFGQGGQNSVYVLELGEGDAANGVAALTTFLTNNPGDFYAFLVPREWSGESTYLTLVNAYLADTAKLYFYTTPTLANYTNFTNTMKSVFSEVEAPGTPTTEFSLAAAFWRLLNYRPSSTNKVAPFAFGDLFGVTAYPVKGNNSLLTTLKAANCNYVGTGAEGGITNTILYWGTTEDGRDMTYWYSVDWAQINVNQAVAAAVINGSNNPVNPLYYNQDGINRLQRVIYGVMSSAVTFGLALGNVIQTALDPETFNVNLDNGDYDGQVVVNAVPFPVYNAANPSHYKEGLYQGFSIVYTPARGFTSIVINLVVTDFVAQ